MKSLNLIIFCCAAVTSLAAGLDEKFDHLFDQLDEALTMSACHDKVRARLSGLVDLEGYYFRQPAPGLLYTEKNGLFNPRLTLFLDAQIGSHLYVFAQTRADHGFDPSDGGAQVRLDEYALRLTPWENGRFNFQIGKFATVIGNWKERHSSWEDPFITAPLPYENVTAIYDAEAPSSALNFLSRTLDEKYECSPVIWGPSYATGASVSGRIGKAEYAAELKNSGLSSRPKSWDATHTGFDHPAVNARFGFRPNPMWNLGVSTGAGPYFSRVAQPTLPSSRGVGDYWQYLLGQDISFALHHLQLRAEFYEVRFEVPRAGNADTFAYYLEGKYKFSAPFYGALRWNQQLFATLRDGLGGQAPWGHALWRTDAAIGWRFTAHTQCKLQYSLQREDRASREFSHLLAAQFTVRF